ncbi:MAG: copper resistance protein CopC [Acidimicrobiales bacterium]
MRRLKRLLAGFGLVTVLLVVWAGTASAHAQLESSDPAAQSVLLIAPTQVVLHFGEPVTVDAGSLRVLGPDGRRIDNGGTHHLEGDSRAIASTLPPRLPKGTYVVAWRVISADAHPVHGAFVYSVGSDRGAAKASVQATALADRSGSTTVGVLYWLIRLLVFASLLVLVGLSWMIALAWRPSGSPRRAGVVLWVSWWVLAVATVLAVAAQGLYGAGLPIGDIIRPSLITGVLRTQFGELAVVRLGLLAVFIGVLRGIEDRASRGPLRWRWVLPFNAVLGLALVLTVSLAGHASTGADPTWGLVLDVLHLSAASVWTGGLALLAVVLIRPDASRGQTDDPGRITRAVSAYALAAVVVVVVTGTLQSMRQVGSVYAFVNTTYGRTLLVKIAIVVVLIALGALSRRLVHRGWGLRRSSRAAISSAPPAQPSSPAPAQFGASGGHDSRPGRLRRLVVAELAVVLAVLAVTALLVNSVPARQAAALPFSTSFTTLGVQVNVLVDPARTGPVNRIHIYVLSSAGTPKAVPELDASLSLAAEELGPLQVPLRVGGPGHYYATHVDIPITGSWTLTITLRTDAINEEVVPIVVPVR